MSQTTAPRKAITILLLVILLIAAAALVYWNQLKPTSQSNTQPRTKPPAIVSLEKPSLAIFELYASALIVAADKSSEISPGTACFADAGLAPTIIKRSKGPDIVDALIGGSADFGTLAVTPVVLQALQNKRLVIFATIQTTDHDIKVVGHRDSNITSGASLKGKRVGFVGGTWGEIFLDRYLAKYKLSKDEVNLTSGGPAQLRDLFLNKSLDAIIIWEPVIKDILLDPSTVPDEVFIDVDPTIYTGTINLVALPEVLKSKNEAAVKLVTALLNAEQIMQNNPKAVQAKLEEWLGRAPGTLEGVFDPTTFHVQLNMPLLLTSLKDEAEWANTSVLGGKGSVPVDYSVYIDTSIMEQADQTRITK